ncbi:MAG: Ku protein [Acidobacteria bacterium]|nr:Ku protein [Acidobacteriota bacterium]
MAEEPEDRLAGPRPFWSGTITFGLVSVPVDLYAANRPRPIALRMLDADGTPLARQFYCPEHDKPVDEDDIVRGYELEDGRHVVIEDEELEKLEPRKSRDIDLRRFVDQEQLDPVFFERAYFLTPSGGSNKAYRLLADVMERTRRAGIATFVMRDKEYLVAILSERGILRAETLRFLDEVRSPEQVGLPEPDLDERAAARIAREIGKRTKKQLPRKELEDDYADRLLKLVERKHRKGTDQVRAPEEALAEPEADVDLMDVLKKSMQAANAGRAKPRRRAGPRAVTPKRKARSA